MAHLLEDRQRRGTHALCRRVWRNEIRVLLLQLTQFTHQTIVFSIRHFRRIHNVIEIFMMAQRGAQFGDVILDGFHKAPSDKKPPTGGGLFLTIQIAFSAGLRRQPHRGYALCKFPASAASSCDAHHPAPRHLHHQRYAEPTAASA